MTIQHVTDASFDQEVLKSDSPVLVDYWAEWCGPCKMIAPILDEVARDYDGKLRVVKVNVDENQSIPSKYGIRGIPTLMLFRGDYKTVQVAETNAVWFLGDYIVSVARFWGLVAMLATVVALWLFLGHTDLGRAIRAVGQDRQVARLLGINDRVIYNYAFGLSTAVMGIAAAVLVPFYYTHPAVGTSFLLKAFVIVVLGGLGSMPGAALGGLAVGLIEGVTGIFTQAAVAQVLLFAVFVAMLFFRPAGLLGLERK